MNPHFIVKQVPRHFPHYTPRSRNKIAIRSIASVVVWYEQLVLYSRVSFYAIRCSLPCLRGLSLAGETFWISHLNGWLRSRSWGRGFRNWVLLWCVGEVRLLDRGFWGHWSSPGVANHALCLGSILSGVALECLGCVTSVLSGKVLKLCCLLADDIDCLSNLSIDNFLVLNVD